MDKIAPQRESKEKIALNISGPLPLLMFCTLLVASGASCPKTAWQPFTPSPPVVFKGQPSLEEVAGVINANHAKIPGLYSTNCRISGSDFPSLRTSLAVGGPRQVRLRAGTGVTGQEMDVGSNPEMFWVWVKRADPPGVYFGRYDEVPASGMGGALPIRPEWVVEAIGLISLPPHQTHEGPFRRNDGMLEIRTPLVGPTGPMTRVLVIDSASGWIRQQQLIGSQGQLIAQATNRDHFRDPDSGAVLPRVTEIDWPAAGMQLTLKLDDVQIAPLDPVSDMWVKPEYPGFPDVRVTESLPNGVPPAASAFPQAAVQTMPESANPWRAADGGHRVAETGTQPAVAMTEGNAEPAIRAQNAPLTLPSSRGTPAAKAFRSRIRSDSRRHGAIFHGRD